jgi:hypothetical protein
MTPLLAIAFDADDCAYIAAVLFALVIFAIWEIATAESPEEKHFRNLIDRQRRRVEIARQRAQCHSPASYAPHLAEKKGSQHPLSERESTHEPRETKRHWTA